MGHARLDAPFGRVIDRTNPINFQFDGKVYPGYEGDTIASALAANNVWVLSRSFKYHRPRGILTMAGHDANTLVGVPGEPNVLADTAPISEGLVVEAQNVSGSLSRDRGAVTGMLSRFLPVGFYYKAFYKPDGIWPRWETFFRRRAGLGVVPASAAADQYYDKKYIHTEVAIIGGGVAGLAAADEAAHSGVSVLLVEQHPWVGGAAAYSNVHAGTSDGSDLESLRRAVISRENVEVMTSAVCTGLFEDSWLSVFSERRLFKVRAREVIVAAGGFEQAAIFTNNDLPGVMMGDAAQRLMGLYGVSPGRHAVVLTGTNTGYTVAQDLHAAGVQIAAIVDFRNISGACAAQARLREAGVEILAGWAPVAALGTRGRKHVRGIQLRQLDASGLFIGPVRTISCDLVTQSMGPMPAYQLPVMAGAKLRYADLSGAFEMTAMPDNLQVAGGANGEWDYARAQADGRKAGRQAAFSLGYAKEGLDALPAAPDHQVFVDPNFSRRSASPSKGKDFIDFDEDLQSKDIIDAVGDGYDDVQLVKRYSTAGMGPSQGRHAALPIAHLVAAQSGRTVGETGVTTARPPLAGEKLAALAGRKFEPVRHSPMHHRHLTAGAQMMSAGVWLRPAYYSSRDMRDATIAEEANNVRTNVGIIDVSTLGGLEFRGPDALEFLQRVYAGSFKKLAPGRIRYGLMVNEMGVVIDDGVIGCIDEHHYFCTTTTTGADAIYRKLMWWNAQWRLAVDIANLTTAHFGINIAGPKAREILARICTDVDFSPEAFPYLGCREGHVADVPVRMLRVGFVGELGYELHGPASYGTHVWDALLGAGEAEGIRPFGVEAQRLLRLEKGHIIIGQDTDGLTHPHEVEMNWAVATGKPVFVGRQALSVIAEQPEKRRLTGFIIEESGGNIAPVPEESCLTLNDGEIMGWVTSAARSPAMGTTIGLAYVVAAKADAGAKFDIKLTNGDVVEATSSPHPFYDAEGLRQNV
jgi:sarcosine oxidase subunit alpha